jgi:hypothetical protein
MNRQDAKNAKEENTPRISFSNLNFVTVSILNTRNGEGVLNIHFPPWRIFLPWRLGALAVNPHFSYAGFTSTKSATLFKSRML